MGKEEQINIEVFKVITKAITGSDNLETTASHLCQLLTAALNIKGCAIFVLDKDKTELQALASFGLSSSYTAKGPINPKKSLGCTVRGESIVIEDTSKDNRLQYPEQALKEGIQAIAAIPIIFLGESIGSFRLYHSKQWVLSEHDVDSLFLLGELMGMALRYTVLFNVTQTIYEVINDLPMDLQQ